MRFLRRVDALRLEEAPLGGFAKGVERDVETVDARDIFHEPHAGSCVSD